MSVIPRLAAGAAALLLGTALATVALPASAAPAAAASHTVTYSPGALPVLGALGITIVPGVSPSITKPDGGDVHTGDTIVFKTTGSETVTVQSTTTNWSFKLPMTSTKPASVTVPGAGTFGYGVGATTATFKATAASSSGSSTQPPKNTSGGGAVGSLLGGPQAAPPAVAAGGGSATNGSGASGSSAGSSGAAGSTGSGSFDSSQFGTGSGDFPNLPGGVFAPVVPQAGSTGGGLAPDIAADPSAGGADGAFGGTSTATTPGQATDTITTASQNSGSGSSVTGPAAIAAALMALVTIGLARAWSTHPPFQRH